MSLPQLVRPTLRDPMIVDLAATGYADTDSLTVRIPLGRDALIRYPRKRRVGHVSLVGGRNRVIVGGLQTIGRNRDGTYPAQGTRSAGDYNIEVKDGDPGGITFLEGLHVDAAGGAQSDGFFLNCPDTIVQMLFCRVEGLLGSLHHGRHADGVQTPAGVRWLALDRCTVASHYNTLYLRRENSPLMGAVQRLTIRCSNTFGYATNPAAGSGDPQYTLRGISLGTQPRDDDCDERGRCGAANGLSPTNAELATAVEFDRFWIDPASAGRDPDRWVWPDASASTYRPAWPVYDAAAGTLSWPLWARQGKVKGVILVGRRPRGDFAKAASVGLNYAKGIWAAA